MLRDRGPLWILTCYLVLVLALPSRAIIGPLGTLGAPSTLLTVGILGLWVWASVAGQTSSSATIGRPVRRAAIALMIVALAVYAHAMTQPMPADEITPADGTLVRFLALVGLALMVSDGLSSREQVWTFVRRLTTGGGLIALLAVFQAVTRQIWIDRIPIPGLTVEIPADASLITRGLFSRPSGTASHPIEFGSVMAMVLPLALARARFARRDDRVRAWLWVGAIGLAVMFSVSRTAIVCSLASVLVLAFAWSNRARALLPFAMLGGIAAVSVAVPGLVGTLRGMFTSSADDPSVASRTESYTYAFDLIGRSPWLGRGQGTFLPRYRILDNGFLGMAIEAGVIGLGAFLALLVVAVVSAHRARVASLAPHDKELAQAIAAAVVAGSLAFAFYDQFAFPQAAGLLFLNIGLAGAVHRLAREEAAETPANPSAILPATQALRRGTPAPSVTQESTGT